MYTTTRRFLAALGLILAPLAAPAHAWEIIPPFKVNFTFRLDIRSTAHPQATAPRWAYFPQGAGDMAPSSGPTFPHWPAQFPPAAQPTSAPHAPGAGPNMVFGNAPAPVQPVGYYLAPPPSYWYGR